MSIPFRTTNPFSVMAICLLLASGCNAFEFLHNEDAADDPAVLLDDAQIALQNGDAAKAVELLEKALAASPDDPKIEVALSNALFQANEIDIVLLKDLADFISEPTVAASKNGPGNAQPACNFSEDPQATTVLYFDDTIAYTTLFNQVDVLQRVLFLLQEAATLEAGATLNEAEVSNARLMRAIASMAMAVIEIKTQADAAEATIHRLSSGGLGYCAVSEQALVDLESFILCEKMPVIDQAVDDMVYRQQLFGAGENELVDALTSARNEIARAIDHTCRG